MTGSRTQHLTVAHLGEVQARKTNESESLRCFSAKLSHVIFNLRRHHTRRSYIFN